jgi:glycosyltransferase involved in cell wall biosynthesis
MITGLDIVIISSIEWSFLWQGHQEIAMRLAQAGNRILYIENTGVRAPGLRDATRVVWRFRRWLRALGSRGVREVAKNVFVCSPVVLPPFGRSWRHSINQLLLPMISRSARELEFHADVVWTYLPTDTAVELIRLFRSPESVTVYYCAADFAQLTSCPEQLSRIEAQIVESSDLVFAVCPELARRCEQWRDEVQVFPPGVDLNAFAPENALIGRDDSTELRLLSPAHPVIGYVGGLHRCVDYSLIGAMARARPEWSWVLIGPLQADVTEIDKLPNVILPGEKPHGELARYIRLFDVCIVPYVKSVYTNTVVPVKINEYLAMGKPVVASDIRAVCDFNHEHDVLTTADPQPSTFLAAIEQMLESPSDPAVVAHRRAVAALSDWSTRVEAMSDLIAAKLVEQNSTVALCRA